MHRDAPFTSLLFRSFRLEQFHDALSDRVRANHGPHFRQNGELTLSQLSEVIYQLELHYFADPHHVPDLLHNGSERGIEEWFGMDLTPEINAEHSFVCVEHGPGKAPILKAFVMTRFVLHHESYLTTICFRFLPVLATPESKQNNNLSIA